MNKLELIREVSHKAKISYGRCKNFLAIVQSVVIETLQKGEMISLVNIGKIYTKLSKERQVYDPQTQQKHTLKPQILLKIRLSPALKGRILG